MTVLLESESSNIEDPGRNAETGEPRRRRESPLARAYYALVLTTAAAAAIVLVPRLDVHAVSWTTFAGLVIAAAVAHFFVVSKPGNQFLKPSIVFVVPAALLLPVGLLPLFVAAQYVPEWLKARTALRVQAFNMAKALLDMTATWAVFHALNHVSALGTQPRFALAGLVACVVYTLTNHTLLALIINLSNGLSLRETGLFSFEHLSTDLIIGGLGVGVAALVHHNVWVVPFLIAPLVLMHRALAIPQLQAEARVDPKTGLFNARHFAKTLAEELARAQRFDRPLSLIMADLDLLRDINNNYGHLAGDAVLQGIAEIFRNALRHYDVPARFGGEEFSILLPETSPAQALEIAERIRRAVAAHRFEVETAPEPIRATVSMGVAGFPKDGTDSNELIHQADLAVYRAKLQGRNRVLAANAEPLLLGAERPAKLAPVHAIEDGSHTTPLPAVERRPVTPDRRSSKPRTPPSPRLLALSPRLGAIVVAVGAIGIAAGAAGVVWGHTTDVYGLLAVVALVGAGQALSLELSDVAGSISVSAVGSLAGAALFDYRAALALAVTSAAVEWSARRLSLHYIVYNIGALSLASLAAAYVFSFSFGGGDAGRLVEASLGVLGGVVYFGVNMTLVSVASAVEGHERPLSVFRERFAWLLPHYVVYGFIGAVIALAYDAVGMSALAVFAVPLLLMRKTQQAYLKHTERSASKLREAADTIQSQNQSLEQANRLLRERSTAAMESLSATVDARDSYTAGHSRRVQQLALAIGRELGLSQAELDLLGHAALFHDIGKLAVPDSILLKPAGLTAEEWGVMQEHADEGARIIDRLGFLQDAVPAIRHHHERFDGSGYPDGLSGEDIPLGARIIHVADAVDSMLTTRTYREARPMPEVMAEVHRGSGSQFCPRCVAALDRIMPLPGIVQELSLDGPSQPRLVRAAS